MHTFSTHKNVVNSVVVSPFNKFIASGSSDNNIKIYSVADKEEVNKFLY